MKNSSFFFIVIILSGLLSCENSDDSVTESINDNQVVVKEKISGFVQKGPYINGTEISMYELNDSLNQSGNNFNTQIIDNKGTFEINNIELLSNFVEFSANGFYFDEVKGEISSSQLNLSALSDISIISSVNVNILTHLEKRRVLYLIKNGKSFTESKEIAQKEILKIFNIAKDGMNESESLDISKIGEENGILLAISVILQGTRSVGDLTELLATISSDIEEDGELTNNNTLKSLRESTIELNLTLIRQNLLNRYQSLGLEASIPDFESHINSFLTYTATEPTVYSLEATNVLAKSVTLNGIVNPNSLTTQVFFEYGKTEQYGSIVEVAESPLSPTGSNLNITLDVNNLDAATKYFFRIKSENEKGITYGEQKTFNTLGDKPIINSFIVDEVNAKNTVVEFSVTQNWLSTEVTLEYSKFNSFDNFQKIIYGQSEDLSSEINGFISAENLDLDEFYYLRLSAENELGNVFSEIKTIQTLDGKIIFEPVFFDSTYLTPETYVYFNIESGNEGGLPIAEKGIVYSTTPGPTLENGTSIVNNASNNYYNTYMPDLVGGVTYYVRGYAINETGVYYSDEIEFREPDVPEVSKTDLNNIQKSSVQACSTISDEIVPVTHGYCWSKSPNPTLGNNTITIIKTENPNCIMIENLEPGTTYFIRAYAENRKGISFGEETEFKTLE